MLKSLRRIHRDEQGLETLQVIMIVAIAAVILAILKVFWPQIRTYAQNMINNITQYTDPSK